jgi:hypothetical protein
MLGLLVVVEQLSKPEGAKDGDGQRDDACDRAVVFLTRGGAAQAVIKGREKTL